MREDSDYSSYSVSLENYSGVVVIIVGSIIVFGGLVYAIGNIFGLRVPVVIVIAALILSGSFYGMSRLIMDRLYIRVYMDALFVSRVFRKPFKMSFSETVYEIDKYGNIRIYHLWGVGKTFIFAGAENRKRFLKDLQEKASPSDMFNDILGRPPRQF